VSQGKSADEIAADLVHEGVGTLQQIEAGAPGTIDAALDESGIPGAGYAATFVDDLVQGKSPEQAAEHAFGQAGGDAFDQSGLGDAFQQTDLDPFRPYLETAAEDFANGKSFGQIAEHIGNQVLGDSFGGGDLSAWARMIDHAGIDLGNLDGGNLPPWAGWDPATQIHLTGGGSDSNPDSMAQIHLTDLSPPHLTGGGTDGNPDSMAQIHVTDLSPPHLTGGGTDGNPDSMAQIHLTDLSPPHLTGGGTDGEPGSMAQVHLTDLSPLQDYGFMSTPYEEPLH
jgi:hypothetical protein